MNGKTVKRRLTLGAGLVAAVLGAQVGVQTPASAALPGAVGRSAQTDFAPAQLKTISAFCPAGTRVTGGGGRVVGFTSHVHMVRLQPVHTNNLDRFEVVARADEEGTSAQWALTAFAICAAPLPGQVIVAGTSTLGSPNNRRASSRCPDGTMALGTGGRITGGEGQVQLNQTTAGPTGGLAQGQEDVTGFVGEWTVTSYAVCADIGGAGHAALSGFSSDPPSAERKIARAICPAGMTITGGSAEIGGGDTIRPVIESIQPEFLPGAIPGNEITVVARENVPTASSWTLRAIATCTT
jgi:hypothetical protein